MCYELHNLSLQDDKELYDMLQTIPGNENGFLNPMAGCSYVEYKAWLSTCIDRQNGVDLPQNRVPESIFWLYYRQLPIGFAKLRHTLNDTLREHGGHVGYAICAPYRGQGHATHMLRLLLHQAQLLGIGEVLITIQDDNLASIKVAEKNGCILRRSHLGVLSYTIDLTAPILPT